MNLALKPLPSGKAIDLSKPSEYTFTIEEIACLLSKVKRFNGVGVDVATHSVWVSQVLYAYTGNPHIAMLGLLHDAAEAYVGDIATPVKHVIGAAWEHLENTITQEIIKQLHGLNQYNIATTPLIKLMDMQLLRYELIDLEAKGVYHLHEAWNPTLDQKDLITTTLHKHSNFYMAFEELKELCLHFDQDNLEKIEATYHTPQGAFTCIIDKLYQQEMDRLCKAS